MPAPQSVSSQNQLASLRMREQQAAGLRTHPFDAFGAAQALGGMFTPIAAVVIGGVLLFALLASGGGEPLLLALISLLAMVGAFFLLAVAGGHIRLSERAPIAEIIKTATDGLESGFLIAKRDGETVYTNDRFEKLIPPTDAEHLDRFEALFTGEPQATAALFRLTRAAERGEGLTEEFALRHGAFAPDGTIMRLSVQPFAPTFAKRHEDPLVLWQVDDVTAERDRETARITAVEAQLFQFDSAPVGLASVSADGMFLYVNATLAHWIGRTPRALVDEGFRLADIISGDGSGLVGYLGSHAGDGRSSLDVDLVRDDGRIFPVRLFAHALAGANGFTIAAVNLTAEKTVESEGEAVEARFARFFQSAPFGIAVLDPEGRITRSNAAFSRMVLDGASAVGAPASKILCQAAEPETCVAVEGGLKRVLSGRTNDAPIEITVGANQDHVTRVYMSPFVTAPDAPEVAVLYVVDATEQKALELKYAQSQKMEVVGKLAGFVAHDFNNMLTAIIGFSDMLLTMHRPKDIAYKDILNIKSSANRAAGLVSKLLALARQQTLQNEVLHMGEALTDLAALLKRSIGEKIELKLLTGRDLWFVKTDKLQLEQAIINLGVNARDAMPDGGTLSIRTRNINERESNKQSAEGLPTGEYVLIEVEDTGHGMSPDVLNKIFEPFFTTKAVGKGTGLGLATVYGIVKQSGGYIFPESEVGKGTTFAIYLPRHFVEPEDEALAAKDKKKRKEHRAADLTGSGRVLLVEDEDVVRSFAVRALKRQGYEVLEASSGVEALEVMEAQEGKIDIVVSDVVMPEMDGPTLLKELRKKNPDLKIIFVSGYPNDAFKESLGEDEFAFLPKPFSLSQLAAKVKEELTR